MSHEATTTTWLASYPKSGNTWLRAQLSALSSRQVFSLNSLGSTGSHRALSSSISMSDLDSSEALAIGRLAWQAPVPHAAARAPWMKTHHAWVTGADGYPVPWLPPGGRAVYIVRDPRAVAVSWAHHIGVTLEESVEFMATDQRPDPFWPIASDVLCTWSEHVRSWLDDCTLPLLAVRYEDMHMQPVTELRRVADFLGIECDDVQVQAAVDECSFTRLAAQEIAEGFAEAAAPDRSFFRRGESESWREELPAALIARVESDHRTMMERLGYLS